MPFIEKDDLLFVLKSTAANASVGQVRLRPDDLREVALEYAREQGFTKPEDAGFWGRIAARAGMRARKLEDALRELLTAQRAFDLAHGYDTRERGIELEKARAKAREVLGD